VGVPSHSPLDQSRFRGPWPGPGARTEHNRKALRGLDPEKRRVCLFLVPVHDNYNLKSHKYVCITTYQPDTKYNPNPNPYPNPSTKQH